MVNIVHLLKSNRTLVYNFKYQILDEMCCYSEELLKHLLYTDNFVFTCGSFLSEVMDVSIASSSNQQALYKFEYNFLPEKSFH